MKLRIPSMLLLSSLLLMFALASPAGANHFTPLSVACTAASGGWTQFPATDQIITLHATQPGSPPETVTVHTAGAAAGFFHVSLTLTGNGLITLTAHAAVVSPDVTATATADCRPPATTTTAPPTTTTTTTTRPPTTTTRPPSPPLPPPVIVRPRFTG